MREKFLFDDKWLFHRGDIDYAYPSTKGMTYISAKTERKHMGPACKDYYADPDCYNVNKEQKSELWVEVTLPHDYIIGDIPDVKYNNGLGFFNYDNAWYRKNFTLDKSDKEKRITLFFEGVASQATVYLNGCLLKHNFCGYTSFEVDITDTVDFEKENVLAVYVSTKEHEGWWYEGGGIYRHVWLIKTEKAAVDLWGVFVKPEYNAENDLWTLSCSADIRNDFDETKEITVKNTLIFLDGNILHFPEVKNNIDKRSIFTLSSSVTVKNPELWSPDSPVLHKIVTEVFTNADKTDEITTRFGFRYFNFDKDKGLFINNKNYKINGLCGHADCGLTGKAVSDNIHRYKVQLMKEMGANGYRTSHYMQAEALMDALDENGFIVLDETRWFESSDEGKEQLRTLIKRDRNRPSVFFWSIGNEETYFTYEQGNRIFRSLKAEIEKLDGTRPVTVAVDFPKEEKVFSECDIIGINYNLDAYDEKKKQYPEKAFLATECSAIGRTRDWYFESDTNRSYNVDYELSNDCYFGSREKTWKFIYDRDYVIGGYQWIAFEYRGEAVWPRICSQSGCIDLFLQKKNSFYQNKAFWSKEPVLHLTPYWNFEGLEGKNIKVVTYANTEETELFLNGKSCGKQKTSRFIHGEWQVPYEPGELKAVGYNCGKAVISDIKVTSGKAYQLKLELDTKDVKANGKDIAIFSCFVVDKNGIYVPNASPTVEFICEGQGNVLSTGSDIADHSSIFSPVRKMRAGRIGVAVKLKKGDGNLKLYAISEGLKSAIFELSLKE